MGLFVHGIPLDIHGRYFVQISLDWFSISFVFGGIVVSTTLMFTYPYIGLQFVPLPAAACLYFLIWICSCHFQKLHVLYQGPSGL